MSRRVHRPLIVLAPHYDDAVFSCGGLIHAHTRRGDPAVVATIFGGAPATEAAAGSPLALALHARWFPPLAATPSTEPDASPLRHPNDPDLAAGRDIEFAGRGVARRRAEDADAMRVLGAAAVVLPFADCIYRRWPDGRYRCSEESELFAEGGEYESGLELEIATALEALAGGTSTGSSNAAARVIAPLGIGNHVDHRLARGAAERAFANRLSYYEDVPYAMNPDNWRQLDLTGVRRSAVPFDEEDMRAKIEAAACYGSQIGTFWSDAAAMARALRELAADRGRPNSFAETLWLPDGVAG